MTTYTIKLDGRQVLKTSSYAKVYRYFTTALDGGCSYGIDVSTLRALGYTWEQTSNVGNR